MDTVSERSFFFALLAAPTAITAEVPHTEVAVARVMTNDLLSIFKTLVPNHHFFLCTNPSYIFFLLSSDFILLYALFFIIHEILIL